MSVREKLKNWWSYQPPSKDELKQPITGGNNFQVQKEFQARLNNMLSSIDLSNDNLDSVVYDEYFLMIFQKNYFCNLFDIETDDIEFKKAWIIFVELCFWYGDAALINNGIEGIEDTTQLIPVYIKEKKYTPLGDIKKDFEYYDGGAILPLMGDSKMWKPKPSIDIKAKVNKSEFVYGKWNTQAYGAWVWMYKFIKFQKELMYLTHGSAYLQKEIFFYKINNVDTIQDEIRTLYNPKINIVPTIGINWEGGETRLENRWLSDKLSNDPSMTINDVYDWHMDKYYELFGRKHNVDFKHERNVTSEVEASQEQFDVLINETKKYMEMVLKECEEKFGKKGVLKLDVEYNYENQEDDISNNDRTSEKDTSKNEY